MHRGGHIHRDGKTLKNDMKINLVLVINVNNNRFDWNHNEIIEAS